MKLSLCVTHYKEPWDVCHLLFDTVEAQQGIGMNDIEMVIVNDGEEGMLPAEELDKYHYRIRYYAMVKGGVSAARNSALDHAEGDYVMFCDCDDYFHNLFGLRLILSAIEKGNDVITSIFIEENLYGGEYRLIQHDKDMTFVHGKVFRRQYLLNEHIRFDPMLTIHEDSYFVSTAMICTESRIQIGTPFYLWRWNAHSVVREDPVNYVMRTYLHLIKCRDAMCRTLKERGRENDYLDCVGKTVCDAYYDFCKPEYQAKENAREVMNAKRSFKLFYTQYSKDFARIPAKRVSEIMCACRQTAVNNGMLYEKWTLRDFLRHIVTEVK